MNVWNSILAHGMQKKLVAKYGSDMAELGLFLWKELFFHDLKFLESCAPPRNEFPLMAPNIKRQKNCGQRYD
jgi:hypothetical protein